MRSGLIQKLLLKLLSSIIKPGTMIVLENAQWMDSSSWSLALAVSQLQVQALLVIVMRPMKIQDSLPIQYSRIVHHVCLSV